MDSYAVAYLAAAVAALLATPVVIRLARAMKIVDLPGARKVHSVAVPRIGGVVVLAAMLAAGGAVVWLGGPAPWTPAEAPAKVFALLAGGLIVCVVGLLDDAFRLGPRVKLLAQVAVALGVCAMGVRIETINVSHLLKIDLAGLRLSWPVTVLWIVGITNAVNLIDGLDGLAAGISAVACGVLAVYAHSRGMPVMAVLMLGLMGSLSGFLVYNFHPARVFLGDCGSMSVGFLLGGGSVICAAKHSTLMAMALPVLVLGLPILDTLFSVARRLLERRSIFSPDRSHLHHRLLDMGLPQRHVVVFLYLVTLLAGTGGLWMLAVSGAGRFLVFGGVVAMLLLVFRLAGGIRLGDTFKTLQRNRDIARQARRRQSGFEQMQLRFRRADRFDLWWRAVKLAAREMGFARIRMELTDRDGGTRILTWRRTHRDPAPGEVISMSIPIRQRRADGPLSAAVDVLVDGSLESAGQRVALFGRLIDENPLAALPREPREDRSVGRPREPTGAAGT